MLMFFFQPHSCFSISPYIKLHVERENNGLQKYVKRWWDLIQDEYLKFHSRISTLWFASFVAFSHISHPKKIKARNSLCMLSLHGLWWFLLVHVCVSHLQPERKAQQNIIIILSSQLIRWNELILLTQNAILQAVIHLSYREMWMIHGKFCSFAQHAACSNEEKCVAEKKKSMCASHRHFGVCYFRFAFDDGLCGNVCLRLSTFVDTGIWCVVCNRLIKKVKKKNNANDLIRVITS